MQFAIPLSGEVSHLALSPDGSELAYVSTEENSGLPVLYVQQVGSMEARSCPVRRVRAIRSGRPTATYLAFFAGGKLQKVGISGGAPQALANVWAARGGSWSKNNVILYEPDSGTPLWRINPMVRVRRK